MRGVTALSVFLVVVTVVVVLGAAVTALAALWLGRHALRIGRVAGRRVRSGWSTARAALPSDAQAVRAERARLDRELAATSNAWEFGKRLLDRSARRRLAHKHEVLVRIGRQLAYELSVAAVDPDTARRDAWLPDLRLRVDAFVVAGSQFRQGVLLASGAFGNPVHVTSVAVDLAAVPLPRAEEPAAH